MRIMLIDIDTTRPDHLGCYGYHRNTSPNIDRLAAEGVRYNHCHASDTPCLPSRAAFHTGRFGIHNGAIDHGGKYADPIVDVENRKFKNRDNVLSWIYRIREDAGLRTVSVSPFAERHSAYWFYAGWNEMYNTGRSGHECADEIYPVAADWLERNATDDDWFFHVNLWDPHTSYRVPEEYGNPFAGDSPPEWPDEETIARHRRTCGPNSALTPHGYDDPHPNSRIRGDIPLTIENRRDFRRWIDGYDIGIRYADDYVGRLMEILEKKGVLDDTVIIVTSDHGENQGELNVYGDHQLADEITTRVPFIIRWPGIGAPRVDDGFYYQCDMSATVLQLLGVPVPETWDGVGFAKEFADGVDGGRPYLVLSHCPWSLQRSVRWNEWLLIRTYHTGLKQLPAVMLFNIDEDPHETTNLAMKRPDVVEKGMAMLQEWHERMMHSSPHKRDPLWEVAAADGPFHTRHRHRVAPYVEYLRKHGYEDLAAYFERRGSVPLAPGEDTPVVENG